MMMIIIIMMKVVVVVIIIIMIDKEKSVKYGPLQWELQERYPGYTIQQYNIIMDVLGGWSRTLEEGLEKLSWETKDVPGNMQKSVVSNALNIAGMFKIIT